jgi:hypothetical protein
VNEPRGRKEGNLGPVWVCHEATVRVLRGDRGPIRGNGRYGGEFEERVSTPFNSMNVGPTSLVMRREEGGNNLLFMSGVQDFVEDDSNVATETMKDLRNAVVNIKYLTILVGIRYYGRDGRGVTSLRAEAKSNRVAFDAFNKARGPSFRFGSQRKGSRRGS